MIIPDRVMPPTLIPVSNTSCFLCLSTWVSTAIWSEGAWEISDVKLVHTVTQFSNSDPNVIPTHFPQHGRLLAKTSVTNRLPLKHAVKFTSIQWRSRIINISSQNRGCVFSVVSVLLSVSAMTCALLSKITTVTISWTKRLLRNPQNWIRESSH